MGVLVWAGCSASALGGPAGVADPVDTPASAFDLVSARVTQDGVRLQVTLRTARRWMTANVSPAKGRTLCVVFDATRSVCVTRGERHPLQLRAGTLDAAGRVSGVHEIRGHADHPDGRTLRLRFTARAAGLRSGPVNWQARSVWTARGGRCPPHNTVCSDAVPDTGAIPFSVDANLTGCTPPRGAELRSGPRAGRRIALTFDDGPSPYTAQYLEVLERAGVVGSFFVVGRNVAGHDAVLRKMLRGGDVIANHSYDHADLTGGAGAELTDTNAAIRRATGFTPCLFRPPYGSTSDTLRADVARDHMSSVLWDIDPRDWSRPGADVIVSRVLSAAHPGAIVVLHDGGGDRTQTLAALPRIIAGLRARHYTLVTVADLLGAVARSA